MSFPVIAIPRVTGAHHTAKMIGTLLFTRSAGAHIIVCIYKHTHKQTNINTTREESTGL